jgi:hypothetical protein
MTLSAAAGQRRTGRPHLGPREVVPAAMWPALLAGVDHARGTLGRSAFLADLLSRRVGRPDLVRHSQLPLDIPVSVRDSSPQDSRPHVVTIRVHPDVAAELDTAASEAGLARQVHIAEEIASELGYFHPTTRTGVLSLAM